jgi:2-dehydro-3-deoxyphosphogluconate aldolase / (4S)-4-hydroxy-2-oxoglutarate aldolase
VSSTLEIGRASPVADAIRRARLVAVLRRVTPRARLLDLIYELVAAGVELFEVTLDAETAIDDLTAARDHLRAVGPDAAGGDGGPQRHPLVGAGTVRTVAALQRAIDAGADFGVSPVLDHAVLDAALAAGLPFIPGAFTPTEVDAAWRSGATFVKLFPGSSAGPAHVRELRGPLPEVELVVTGGVDPSNAAAFLAAGAVAVGIGSALLRASPDERRRLVAEIVAAPRG